MVKITEQLIRKKSEHNELLIFSLEELSLHQENIDRIEHVQDWCRELRILLLQSNLIWKIENLHKLKKLEYLNLAINNVERIENLHGCESLQKLDLTLNFIGELTSVDSLKSNIHLRELFLTGNPCTDYPFYRDYVIVSLSQLESLDGQEITGTERLKAQKRFDEHRREVVQLQAEYQILRDQQKQRVALELQQFENVELDDEIKLQEFWNTKSENCPEIRSQIAEKSRRNEANNDVKSSDDASRPPKRQVKLFSDSGRPYCLNLAKLDFKLLDEPDRYELDLRVYRFLDTSLIDVDCQPNYVRVTVKGRIFQMALNDEIRIDEATSKRSQTTGRLLIVMPKLNAGNLITSTSKKNDMKSATTAVEDKLKSSMDVVDVKNIVVDETEVPPLI